jgi:hypothetical protein
VSRSGGHDPRQPRIVRRGAGPGEASVRGLCRTRASRG